MEKLTSLNLSFDKVLIHWIIPGMLLIVPWIFTCNTFFERIRNYFNDTNLTVAIFAIVIVSLVIGLLIDIVGSYIEVKCFDSRLVKKEDPDLLKNWQKFLAIAYVHEPIGHRYLRNVLLGMKFELSFGMGV